MQAIERAIPKPYFLALVVALPLAACGNSSNISAAEACMSSSTAVCAEIDRCQQNGTTIRYGSAAVCQSRQMQNCLESLMAMGSNRTPAQVQACAMDRANQSCTDFFAGKLSP